MLNYLVNWISKSVTEEGIHMHDLGELHKEFHTRRTNVERNIYEQYGLKKLTPASILEYFQNENSSAIEEIMFRDGKWSTNKNVLKALVLLGRQDAADILEYRRLKKYEETIVTFSKERGVGNVIRPIVSLGKTNRINYSNPPLMNIPKDLVWRMIKPRKKGGKLISVDIKNQEPWIMIHMLGIEHLKDMIKSGEDLYSSIYLDIFGEMPNELERDEIKTCWNALTYGATKYGIERICNNIDGERVYKYFHAFPEFKRYKKKCSEMARHGVKLTYTYFNSKVYAGDEGNALQRVLMDLPIQGTGADILSFLVRNFNDRVMDEGLDNDLNIYYTRLDEMIIEVSEQLMHYEEEEKVCNYLLDVLEHQVDDWEPFKLKIEVIDQG